MFKRKLFLFACSLFAVCISTKDFTLAQPNQVVTEENTTILGWIIDNKEWLFSGVGCIVLGFLINKLFFNQRQNNFSRQKAKTGKNSTVNQTEKGSIVNNAPANFVLPVNNNPNTEMNDNRSTEQSVISGNDSSINQSEDGDIINFKE